MPMQISNRIETTRVELYATSSDRLRLAMEVLLTLCIAYLVYAEARGLLTVGGGGSSSSSHD